MRTSSIAWMSPRLRSAWRRPRQAMMPSGSAGRMKWRLPMTEGRLHEAASKAARAQELLDNELLAQAFESLEKNYIAAWRVTTIDDAAGREKLFLAINIVGKVRDHLASIVANGRLAEAELKELAHVAERKRRFGIHS